MLQNSVRKNIRVCVVTPGLTSAVTSPVEKQLDLAGKILVNSIQFTKFAKVPLPELCTIANYDSVLR